MTVKLVVLYTAPEDPDAFERHYLGTHAGLVDAMPGLLRWESARIAAAADGGERTYVRMAELYFADQAALDAAQRSAEGRATAEDYKRIAPPGSRLYVANVD